MQILFANWWKKPQKTCIFQNLECTSRAPTRQKPSHLEATVAPLMSAQEPFVHFEWQDTFGDRFQPLVNYVRSLHNVITAVA